MKVKVSDDLPWYLYIKQGTAPYIDYLHTSYIIHLSTIQIVVFFGLIISVWVSKRLVAPILKLTQVTTELPQKLLSESAFRNLPQSRIAEINTLSVNFQLMAAALQQKFIEKTEELKKKNEEDNKKGGEMKFHKKTLYDWYQEVIRNFSKEPFLHFYCKFANNSNFILFFKKKIYNHFYRYSIK